MKSLSLIFVAKDVDLTAELQAKTSQELMFLVIRNIILTYASTKRGLDEEERRKYYKICDAFEKILKSEGAEPSPIPETIELEDDWMGFIRKCKRECNLMPDKLLEKVEEIIEAVKDR